MQDLASSEHLYPPVGLTERQQEILCLVARGHTNREIADSLGLNENTVERHRRKLRDKLGFKTRSELVAYAFRKGLVS